MALQDHIAAVSEWVASHVEQDEQIELALLFDPGIPTDDVYVLEVISGFGFDQPAVEKEIMENVYTGEGASKITGGSFLHLFLTSPKELEVAVRENWPSVRSIRSAVARNEFVSAAPRT